MSATQCADVAATSFDLEVRMCKHYLAEGKTHGRLTSADVTDARVLIERAEEEGAGAAGAVFIRAAGYILGCAPIGAADIVLAPLSVGTRVAYQPDFDGETFDGVVVEAIGTERYRVEWGDSAPGWFDRVQLTAKGDEGT